MCYLLAFSRILWERQTQNGASSEVNSWIMEFPDELTALKEQWNSEIMFPLPLSERKNLIIMILLFLHNDDVQKENVFFFLFLYITGSQEVIARLCKGYISTRDPSSPASCITWRRPWDIFLEKGGVFYVRKEGWIWIWETKRVTSNFCFGSVG